MSWSTEVKIYTFIWTSAVLYSIYRFVAESHILFSYVDDIYGDFRPGWPLLNRLKDNADFEWETFMYVVKKLCAWNFLQITLTESVKYVNCGQTSEMVMAFGAWAIYGYGYTMGQAFHIKYTVLYGISTKVSKFEGITVPMLPKCIGRIHLYSDMWKYFDPGLHKFLVRYIYIPTMRNKKTGNKIFSSFLCFTFVYIWHGLETYVMIWAFLNFVGVSVEMLSTYFYEEYMKNSVIIQNMGDNCLRRLKCVLASPLLMMSAVSNFYFFAGANIGDIFVMRILHGDYSINILLLFTLYCCCQVSTELKQSEKLEKLNATSEKIKKKFD